MLVKVDDPHAARGFHCKAASMPAAAVSLVARLAVAKRRQLL